MPARGRSRSRSRLRNFRNNKSKSRSRSRSRSKSRNTRGRRSRPRSRSYSRSSRVGARRSRGRDNRKAQSRGRSRPRSVSRVRSLGGFDNRRQSRTIVRSAIRKKSGGSGSGIFGIDWSVKRIDDTIYSDWKDLSGVLGKGYYFNLSPGTPPAKTKLKIESLFIEIDRQGVDKKSMAGQLWFLVIPEKDVPGDGDITENKQAIKKDFTSLAGLMTWKIPEGMSEEWTKVKPVVVVTYNALSRKSSFEDCSTYLRWRTGLKFSYQE